MASSIVREHAAHALAVGIPAVMLGVGLAWDAVRTRRREGRRHSHAGRSWLAVAALASVAAAVVHLTVTPEHFGESALYGVFFVCAATAQLVGAGLLVTRPSRALVWATVGGNIAIIVLWLMTRLVEVPIGPGAGTTEPFGGRDIAASGCELIVALACVKWLALQRRRSERCSIPLTPLAVRQTERV